MYQEMTAVKDQVVVSLTNQVNNDCKLVKSVCTPLVHLCYRYRVL